MKKILSIICVAVIGLTASSCKKETIVQGSQNLTIIDNLSTNDWVSDDGGITWHADINVPELNDTANTYGGVLLYLSFTDGVWEQVPEVYNGVSYSYTHNNGNVRVYAQKYNGTGAISAPDSSQFKIILVDSGN